MVALSSIETGPTTDEASVNLKANSGSAMNAFIKSLIKANTSHTQTDIFIQWIVTLMNCRKGRVILRIYTLIRNIQSIPIIIKTKTFFGLSSL